MPRCGRRLRHFRALQILLLTPLITPWLLPFERGVLPQASCRTTHLLSYASNLQGCVVALLDLPEEKMFPCLRYPQPPQGCFNPATQPWPGKQNQLALLLDRDPPQMFYPLMQLANSVQSSSQKMSQLHH